MSSAPPPPQQSGSSAWAGCGKVSAGCACGCVVVAVLVVVAIVMFVRAVVLPLRQAAESMEAATAGMSKLHEGLQAMDAASPSRVPEDVATAELGAEDVARYVAVRDALSPALQAADAARKRTWSELDPERLGGMPSPFEMAELVTGVAGSIESVASAERQLLQAAHDALAAQGMGPTELARLAEIVEWRFLERPEALALTLSEWDRREHARHRLVVDVAGAWAQAPAGAKALSESERLRVEREVASAREALAALEAEARKKLALSATTRSALEARRANLERWGPAGADLLGGLVGQRGPLESLFSGGFPGPFGGNVEWSTSRPSQSEEPGR